MEKLEGSSLVEFLNRRLHPVKVTVNLLARELELATGESVTLSKEDVVSIITALDIFIEDYEKVTKIPTVPTVPTVPKERKFVDISKKIPVAKEG
jgi:hypothetical protein